MSLWFLTKYGESPGHFFFLWAVVFGLASVLTYALSLFVLWQSMVSYAGGALTVVSLAGMVIALGFGIWSGIAVGFALLSELVVASSKDAKREETSA